ncbi:hypothetical protein L228DRAFT_240348 [Xylona heveae TC161]|uniref:Uncharacterized protein n=1 Tax=Xylona heveae (strain CBS 132557 / TC161) TaxID=1328760 RepID=A0A165AJ54_XYLHT|nr:hypothetical protein L228DRAFT_240348 [Xylona heveae TC161]KZF20566.1 hypothetical protein L228DRAFT_240348 [Xylona heveae TC161]
MSKKEKVKTWLYPPVSPEFLKGMMPAMDVEFLAACLKHTTVWAVDAEACKNALDYRNAMCVRNRLKSFESRFGITIPVILPDVDETETEMETESDGSSSSHTLSNESGSSHSLSSSPSLDLPPTPTRATPEPQMPRIPRIAPPALKRPSGAKDKNKRPKKRVRFQREDPTIHRFTTVNKEEGTVRIDREEIAEFFVKRHNWCTKCKKCIERARCELDHLDLDGRLLLLSSIAQHEIDQGTAGADTGLMLFAQWMLEHAESLRGVDKIGDDAIHSSRASSRPNLTFPVPHSSLLVISPSFTSSSILSSYTTHNLFSFLLLSNLLTGVFKGVSVSASSFLYIQVTSLRTQGQTYLFCIQSNNTVKMSDKGVTNLYKPTDAEARLLIACFRNIGENVNDKAIAIDTGYKTAVIARQLFNRLKKMINDAADMPKVKAEKTPKAATKRKAAASKGDETPKKRGRKTNPKLSKPTTDIEDDADDEESVVKPEEAILLDEDLNEKLEDEDDDDSVHETIKVEPNVASGFTPVNNPFIKKEAVTIED